jgi:cellobiose phosphorylase
MRGLAAAPRSAPEIEEEIYFVLGQGRNREHALELVKKYHEPAYIGAALERTQMFWDHLLGTVQVRTPDPAMDLILNRWMLYQCLSCRIWGRSAFYQPSGAFGFRDQLQDVLALLPIDPPIARGQILERHCASSAGDVLHWWHPPSGRGVRTVTPTTCYGFLMSLLFTLTQPAMSLLDEKIPFLEAPPLKKDENERYNQYPQTMEAFSLLEHCYRALKGMTRGPHGLPLIGSEIGMMG